jgi:hypothetical protein
LAQGVIFIHRFFAMKAKHITLLSLAVIMLSHQSHGAVLAEWDTTGFTGTETSIASSGAPIGLTVSAIGIGSELNTTSGEFGMNTTSWSTALNATGNNYYGFTVTVATSYQLQLTTWNFTARSSNAGPGNFVVRYSGDLFASDIGTFSTTGDAYGNVSIDLSSLGVLGAGAYEFRVGLQNTIQSDGVGDVATNGTHRVMNVGSSASAAGPTAINLNGTLTSIPELSATLLSSLGLLGLVCRRRRR